MSRKSNSKEMVSGILLMFLMALSCGGCVAVGYYYDRFTEVYAMKSAEVHGQINTPYNHPLVTGDEIYLSKYENGSIDLGEVEFFIDREGSLPGQRVLIEYQNTPLKTTIYLKNYREAVAGKWRGITASLLTKGAIDGDLPGFPGHLDETWGSSLPSTFKGITPYFTVSIPINNVDLDSDFNDRVIFAEAQIKIELPYGSGPGTFEAGATDISHEFEILVLSPDEVSNYKEFRRHYRLTEGLPLLLISIGILVGSVAVILGLGNFWRKHLI